MADTEELPYPIRRCAIDQNLTTSNSVEQARSGSDNDDGYVVELRMPQGRKTKITRRKFQLQLRNVSSESDDDTDSSADSAEATTAQEASEEAQQKPCTAENWREFILYEQERPGGSLVAASADIFERSTSKNTQPLLLSKYNNGQVELCLKSPFLQAQLRKVVDIEYHNRVIILATEIILLEPFGPLFHHIEDMKTNVATNTDATDVDRAHMNALYFFTTRGMVAGLFKDIRSRLSQGLVIYDELWALFRPGDHVVEKSPLGYPELSKITSVKLEREYLSGGAVQMRWRVTLLRITWRDALSKRTTTPYGIETFAGARRITDLPFYPICYDKSPQTIRENAIRAGQAWKRCCEGEPMVVNYKGQALSVTKEATSTNSIPSPIQYNVSNLSSTVIVDPLAYVKVIQQAEIDTKQLIQHPLILGIATVVGEVDVSEFTEEDFIVCPSNIIVFSLDRQNWYCVNVTRLTPKIWKPEVLDRLVLDQKRKDALTRIASTNSQAVQAAKSVDVIEGKGEGVVLLLHGPPGVGKTLTAEVLSEFSQRPLLKVNLGRVASHKKWEETLEYIFSNAEDWKAILLIDEAEIVLEKRTFERMTQNSWISVFLHKLEYYKGILILTTNLVDCIDEAFESRISYPIRFRELRRDDRRQIWTDFIKDMTMLSAYKANLLDEVDRWSEAEINGRQIRNIILMAENLAANNEQSTRLLPSHIDEMLDVTLEFCYYNHSKSAKMKKIQSTGLTY